MRTQPVKTTQSQPRFLDEARRLDAFLKTLTAPQLAEAMHLSATLAEKTHKLIADWTAEPTLQTPAIDCFVGDIYSGLRAHELSPDDRVYADTTLGILSGLYGLLRPTDGICPYRLEMGYKFPDTSFKTMYDFWGKSIAAQLPDGLIVNVSSAEYMRVITPFVDPSRIVTPNFLTTDPKTGEPTFRAVHAKIARGAFARWLITTKITDVAAFKEFNDLGYRYSRELSTPTQPTFVCSEFGGKGLSVRLTPARH